MPGTTPPLITATTLPIRFLLGVPPTPPDPTGVTSGVQNAVTQFVPSGGSYTSQQNAALNALSSALTTLGTAMKVANPGDLADLTVVQLELDQAGLLLGVGS